MAMVACGDGRDALDPEAVQTVRQDFGRVIVSAQKTSFSVKSIGMRAGITSTVTFENNDTVPHTFTVFLSPKNEFLLGNYLFVPAH